MDIRQRLATNLKRLRAAKGLSQEKFAFERGARNPSITILDRLASALGVSASDLVAEPQSAE